MRKSGDAIRLGQDSGVGDGHGEGRADGVRMGGWSDEGGEGGSRGRQTRNTLLRKISAGTSSRTLSFPNRPLNICRHRETRILAPPCSLDPHALGFEPSGCCNLRDSNSASTAAVLGVIPFRFCSSVQL